MPKSTALTITELVHRLNQLPVEVHREGEHAAVSETDNEVVIRIPTKVFRGEGKDVLSLLLPHGGLHQTRSEAKE